MLLDNLSGCSLPRLGCSNNSVRLSIIQCDCDFHRAGKGIRTPTTWLEARCARPLNTIPASATDYTPGSMEFLVPN